jgi:hypothetical protein
MQLQDIQKQLKNAEAKDAYTRAHLADASMKIKKALNAQFTIGGGGGGGGDLDFSMFFGE